MSWVKTWYSRVWTVMIASLSTASVVQAQQPVDADSAAWAEARRADTYGAYQRYLEEFPVGRYAGDAFQRMIEESIEQEMGGTRSLGAADLY